MTGQTMRQNGNASVNKIYNPRNLKPGIPLDVDEVDSAMERFIRQKYQERSLADGKPRPPSRDEISIPTRSPQPSPPVHIQPAKRGKIFGFKLRASSSAYPASKRDTRNLPPLEPTTENAFRTELRSSKPSKPRASDVSEKDKANCDKLAALREMGFPDDRRNSAVLKRLSGDLSRTAESLARLGEGGPDSRKSTPVGSKTSTPSNATFPDSAHNSAANGSGASNNPFDRPTGAQALAAPFAQGHQAASPGPFDVQYGPQSAFQPVDQAFQAMQISSSLFPHSTAAYHSRQSPIQDPRFQHSMTPPGPGIPEQYGHTTSPSTVYSTNPFFQPVQPQATGVYDSYAPTQQNAPFSAPPTNPFFGQQSSSNTLQQPPQSAPLQSQGNYSNSFGIPASPQSAPANQQQNPSLFDHQSTFYPGNGVQSSFYQDGNSLSQFQSQPSGQYQPQPSPMGPAKPGRFDKHSILALYNYPHLAPQPMPTIPDDPTPSAEIPPSDPLSPAPQQTSKSDSFPNSAFGPGRRSATMPVSTASTCSPTEGAGSRNPFLSGTNGTSQQNSTASAPGVARPPPASSSAIHRHASQESVSIANLESGRHSPDAFANLSARLV
jgi:hypothetical protein